MMFQGIPTAVRSLTCTLVLGLGLAGIAMADGVADKVTINDPYVRAVPPVVTTTAAFMQIQSNDVKEHFIVAASSPAAGVVELHMHEHDGGVMRMRQIPHIHLPPAQTVELKPGGLHVMLFNIEPGLQVDDKVPLTLTFDDGSTLTINAVVRSVEKMMMNH